MLCSKLSSELEAVETHEVGLSMAHLRYNKVLVKGCAREKGAEREPKAMRCMRVNKREPGEENSTNSRPEVKMLFQF